MSKSNNNAIIPLVQSNNNLSIDLYHGTSTLFLDSIIQNGLGAVNIVEEWNLLELCKEVYNLSEEYLRDTALYSKSAVPLKQMSEQLNSGSFNYQHGNTYLSPSKQTACNYAINEEYGSEILTYIIKFLKELLSKDVKYVKEHLFKKYSEVFGLIEANPSPLLVQVSNVNIESLLDEHGGDPSSNLTSLNEWIISLGRDFFETLSQQTNFRIIKPVQVAELKFYLINVQKWTSSFPKYNLYEIISNN